MNDQPAQADTPPEQELPSPDAKPRVRRERRTSHTSVLVQVTLLVLLALFVWQWFDTHRQMNSLQQEVARRLSTMDDNSQANATLVKQEQESIRELSDKVATLQTQSAEMQNQKAALSALYQNLSGSRDEIVLADVEQILMTADQQLQLAANVKAALIALQLADDRLRQMNRAALAGVRKVIDHDMEKLRALPEVDVPGISGKIDNLIDAVDTLPLTQELRLQQETSAAASHAPVAGETYWQRFWRETWEQARHLVTVENTQKQEMPLLSPSEAYFLRENLKLRLLSARLALLAHDETSYKQDLHTAQDWIKRYFDAKSPAVGGVLNTLRKLDASSISIKLPDISDSLVAVRNYRASLSKGAQ